MGAVVVFLLIALLVVMALRAIPSMSRRPDGDPRRPRREDGREVLWYLPWTWSIGDADGTRGDDFGGGDGGGAGGD